MRTKCPPVQLDNNQQQLRTNCDNVNALDFKRGKLQRWATYKQNKKVSKQSKKQDQAVRIAKVPAHQQQISKEQKSELFCHSCIEVFRGKKSKLVVLWSIKMIINDVRSKLLKASLLLQTRNQLMQQFFQWSNRLSNSQATFHTFALLDPHVQLFSQFIRWWFI